MEHVCLTDILLIYIIFFQDYRNGVITKQRNNVPFIYSLQQNVCNSDDECHIDNVAVEH